MRQQSLLQRVLGLDRVQHGRLHKSSLAVHGMLTVMTVLGDVIPVLAGLQGQLLQAGYLADLHVSLLTGTTAGQTLQCMDPPLLIPQPIVTWAHRIMLLGSSDTHRCALAEP